MARQRFPGSPSTQASVLVVRTDRLGDVILTLPVLSVLRDYLPHARLMMLLRRYTGQIVEGSPDVDEILWYDDARGPVSFLRMVRTLRRFRFEAAIVARPELRVALLLACARIPIRVGTGFRYYSWLFTDRVFEHRRTAEKHEVEYNLALLKPLGIPLDAAALRFAIRIAPEERRAVEARLHSLGALPGRNRVIIHPGSGGSAREWPLQHFAELARRLQQREDVQVFVTGTPGERRQVDEVARRAGSPALDLGGLWTIRELAAVIQSASLLVSNSTGPLHLAAALGTPVLGFYPMVTPMSARRWGPYGAHAEVLEAMPVQGCPACAGGDARECLCMESIGVDRALEVAERLLKRWQHPKEPSLTHV